MLVTNPQKRRCWNLTHVGGKERITQCSETVVWREKFFIVRDAKNEFYLSINVKYVFGDIIPTRYNKIHNIFTIFIIIELEGILNYSLVKRM